VTRPRTQPRVFMMDLWATVPYYTAYLSRALLREHTNLTVGSISYYLDPGCFSSRGIPLDPGLLNIVGRFPLPKLLRRALKLSESIVNLCALSIRFLISPPDILHVQYLPLLRSRLPLDLWFVKLSRLRGSKIVLTVHDLLPHDTGDTHRQTFYGLYRMVDKIICHSGNIKSRLIAEFSVPSEKISVIPHGPFFYDLPATIGDGLESFAIDPNKTLVLWQGIIFPYKGVDLLLDAWQKVEATNTNACLLIAGTGAPELLQQIQSQIANLHLKNVILHPRFISADELVAIYRAADIVVYPYRAITTSGALATGLALGKAIIATDLPVFRELLTNGETALLIDPKKPGELERALTQLISDPSLRSQLAAAVTKMEFGDKSWKFIAQSTVGSYESVLFSHV
jgi:glycosyltransferase involved in cell wall biosynthesis